MPQSCFDIHGGDCRQSILPDYKFCPRCGRRSVALAFESRWPMLLPLQPKVLQIRGTGSLRASFSLEPGELHLKQAPTVVGTGARAMLVLEYRPTAGTAFQAERRYKLKVLSDDGPPTDPWNSATRFRERIATIILKSPSPARLEVTQELAVFSPNASLPREIVIGNSGETTLCLAELELPDGYEIHQLNGSPHHATILPSLAPGHSVRVAITMRPKTPAGDKILSIESEDGEQQKTVILRAQPGQLSERRPEFYIGIDFGTSGTSMVLREVFGNEGANPRARARFLYGPGHEQRFPTAIYVRLSQGVQTGFFIGSEALDEAEEDRRLGHEGFLVEELKTALRGEEEPYIKFGERYTLVNLLATYLRELRQRYIIPALGDHPDASIGWCFSLPVLDSHRDGSRLLYERQRRATEEAIRKAGFLTAGCTSSFYSEPYCAAVYLMQRRESFRSDTGEPPQHGDWACVFDSGGGTTDMVLGQIQYNQGRMQFEEVATLGGTETPISAGQVLAQANSTPETVTTFGGKRVTERLAGYLTLDRRWFDIFDSLLRSDDLTMRPAKIQPVIEALNLEADKVDRGEAITGPRWFANEPLLIKNADELKMRIAIAPPGKSEVIPNSTASVPPPSITREDFDRAVVASPLSDVRKAVLERLFGITNGDNQPNDTPAPASGEHPRPSDVKWIFAVGGNSRVRYIKDKWLPGLFGRDIVAMDDDLPGATVAPDLPAGSTDGAQDGQPSERLFAVAGGTVWAGESRAHNAVPYTLILVDQNDDLLYAIYANDTFSDQVIFKKHWFTLTNTDPKSQIKAYVAENGRRWCVGQFEISNPDADQIEYHARMAAHFEGRTFVVESVENQAPQRLWSYRF